MVASILPNSPHPIENSTVFELLPGKLLDIQLNHPVKVRIKIPLVGYSLGKYIILKYPSEHKFGNYRDVLVEGNVAIVRYLLEGEQGECFAFRATISHIVKFPEKLLVLTYPTKIENRQLRLHQRIVTHLPATIMVSSEDSEQDDVKLKGIIGDISTQGCGFTFKAANSKVKVNTRNVFVCVTISDGDDVIIPGYVCNSRNEQGKVNVGVKFQEGDKQVTSLLERLFIEASVL